MQSFTLSFLSQADKEKIHQAALCILSDIGMQVFHDEALALLKKAGGTIEKNQIVKIPGNLIEKAVQTAPTNIMVYDRENKPVMDIGGYRCYFGPGSDLLYSIDSKNMQRFPATLREVIRAARVCDALANIDFIMSYAHPSDVLPHQSYLKSFQAMVENSTKPIVCTAENRNDLHAIWKIASILRSDALHLQQKPYFMCYVEPISPLKHPFESLDKLLFCAEKKIPIIYSPVPIAGSTAPITIAGHVAQGLAECLCGLVIHQLKMPGAPFIMGVGPAVLDMVSSQCSYNAPEYYLAYMAIIEMIHYYNLPSWGYAGTSDSKIPDGQATFEAGLCTFLTIMAGANLNHDIGYLDFGLTGSLEMIVISDEMIDQMLWLKKGISIEDETLGLDTIREASFQGSFLTHPHTLKHFRTTQWRPRLFNRKGYEKWQKEGSLSLVEQARRRLHEIEATHAPQKILKKKAQAIQNIVEHFVVNS